MMYLKSAFWTGPSLKEVLFTTGSHEDEVSPNQPRPQSSPASLDVTSPVKLAGKIRLGSKPPPLNCIARIGLGTRLSPRVNVEG